MDDVAYEDNKDLRKWFNNNIETFARAWLDGYEVEKEKRYVVKFKGINEDFMHLFFGEVTKKWRFGASRFAYTRKELEEAGFGEVFNSPLVEVEEVEE